MLSIFLAMSLAAQVGESGGKADAVANALSGLYQENRAKFDSGRIWFDFTDAFAKNADEAAKGVVSDGHKADGFYAFRGAEAIYVRTFSDASMVATSSASSEGKVSHRLQNVRALTDGKANLMDHVYGNPDGKVTRGVIINPGAEAFYKAAGTPLSVGFPDNVRDDLPSTARLIRDGSAGVSFGKIQDDATLDGIKVVRLEVKMPGGDRVMWVDPERGAIPIRTHDEMPGGSTYDLHYGDIRMIDGRGWFPFEKTEYLAGGRVMRMVITKVDFGKVPDDTFRLEFPEPIAMVDRGKGLSYPPRKVWDLSNLPPANSKGTAALKTFVNDPDPVMPAERESRTPFFTFVGLGLAAIVGVVGLLWRRGSRRPPG